MSRIDEITYQLSNPDLTAQERQNLEAERYRLVSHHTLPLHDREAQHADYVSVRDGFQMRRIEKAIEAVEKDLAQQRAASSPDLGRIRIIEYTLHELEEQRNTIRKHYERLPLDATFPTSTVDAPPEPAPQPPLVIDEKPDDLPVVSTTRGDTLETLFERMVENVYQGLPTLVDPTCQLMGQDKDHIREILRAKYFAPGQMGAAENKTAGQAGDPLAFLPTTGEINKAVQEKPLQFFIAGEHDAAETTTTPKGPTAPDGGNASTTGEVSEDSSASTSGDN